MSIFHIPELKKAISKSKNNLVPSYCSVADYGREVVLPGFPKFFGIVAPNG
jgi:hypothetical protein